eukprot:4389826-Amphidinium_carterae.1
MDVAEIANDGDELKCDLCNRNPEVAVLIPHLCLPGVDSVKYLAKHNIAIEATTWSKVIRGKAVGTQCAQCARVAKSFPQHSWDTIVAKQASNSEFKKEIDKCRKVLEGQREKPANQNFDDEDNLELRMTRSYVFVAEDDKDKAFGAGAVIPSDIPKVELKDERGQPIAGFLFRSEDPFRMVEASWSTSTRLSTSIMPSSSQIRHNQGQDIAEWWRADVLEHRPGPLAAKPKAALVTVAEAHQKIRDAVAKEEVEKKEREAAAAAAAASGGGDAAMMPAPDAPLDQAE